MSEIIVTTLAAAAWALWGLGHSVTASTRFKAAMEARFGLSAPALRRWYNVFALVSLVPVVWISWIATRSATPVIEYTGVMAIVPWLALGLALLIFVDTLRVYNAREFAGLAEEDKAAGLRFATSHRFVRHPWYFAILLLLWMRELSVADAVVSGVLTLYLVIGTRCEEKRLAANHPLWRTYAKVVPMLVPWPRRYLTTDRLASLVSQTD